MFERLEWVLKNRKEVRVTYVDDETKRRTTGPLNKGTWAMAAGLGRTALYNQMKRMQAEPHRTLNATTVDALARVAGISSAWLLNGHGDPLQSERPRNERYDVMPIVRDAARADGFDADFVEKFEVALDFDGQPTFSDLWVLMQAAYKAHQRKVPPKGDPLAGLDEPLSPRPQTARKKR